MLKRIFLIISILLLAWLGWEFFDEYFFHHSYYTTMLASWQNWKVVCTGFIFALIPAGYLLFAKQKKRRGVVATLFVGLFLFMLTYVEIKAELLGGSIKLFINVLFLLGLALYMLVSFVAVGAWIKERFLRLPTQKVFDIIMNLGIGLAIFLVINYLLIILNLFFPLVSRILFAVAGRLMWISREKLAQTREILVSVFDHLTPKKFHSIWYTVISLPLLGYSIFSLVNNDVTLWTSLLLLVSIGLIGKYMHDGLRHRDRGVEELFSVRGMTRIFVFFLLLLSLWYIFNGVTLALIPYPTAWDANHAYMFVPKMRALNNGYYRNEASMAIGSQLWYSFIAYWFSLFTPFTNFLGLSPDAIAIEMNFWSGFLVLIFGLGLIAEVLTYLQENSKREKTHLHTFIFLVGRFLLLQWLMSGMGAFLVFIDNKTDLAVLALIILAIYSGFVFLRQVHHEHHDFSLTGHHHHRTAKYLIGLSGFFYAIAALAKPTAMFDVVNFGLFTWWVWFGRFGVIGAVLAIIGILSLMKFRGISDYLPAQVGTWLAPLGALGIGVDLARMMIGKTKVFVRYFLIWIGVFFATFLLIKLPFQLADYLLYDRETSPKDFVKSIFLVQTSSPIGEKTKSQGGLSLGRSVPLLVQATGEELGEQEAIGGTGDGLEDAVLIDTAPSVVGPTMCTLAGQGLSSAQELYEKLQKAEDTGYDEDVGRYVGYGWKGNPSDLRRNVYPFINPWRASRFADGCYGFNPLGLSTRDAKLLCQTESQWKTVDVEQMSNVHAQLNPQGQAARMLAELIALISDDTRSDQEKVVAYGPEFQALEVYMQDNTIKMVTNALGVREVYVPYRFLNPFNISFNWSLQNLSSYYTDIGLVWIILLIFTVVGLLYGLIARKHQLIGISLVTLFGWILWWFVGGGILWYAIGLVIWTILAFIFYLYYLLRDDEQPATSTLSYLFLVVFIIFGLIQMTLNLVRISSQGGSGAFVWYKTNFGIQQLLTDQLQVVGTPQGGFGQDDVFNLQFPHYKDFITLANARNKEQGILIAGTYARYFIENQSHVRDDGFLGWLAEMSSDYDACNTYLRLKDNHIKYLAIDPNIGTVVQGAGNQSLFDRFFGRVNDVTSEIEAYGAMTMLAKLYKDGYVNYVSSNNIGAKYAFSLPDSVFAGMQGDTLTIFRARMAVARYFGNAMLPPIVEIALQRVKDGTFVTDIADIMGLQVDDEKLLNIVAQGQPTVELIATLTQDERRALQQFIVIRQQATTGGDDALRQTLTSLITNSIGGGNQIIVLEMVD